MFTPIKVNEINGGEQKIYRFDNGYGASVIRHRFSYGYSDGKWELAVISFGNDDEWGIDCDSGITDDVLGWLDETEVNRLLIRIANLKGV